jgi:hypothetical protein
LQKIGQSSNCDKIHYLQNDDEERISGREHAAPLRKQDRSASAYDECMHRFWEEFGTSNRQTLLKLPSALNSIKPKGKTNQQQLEFVHEGIGHFNLLMQCAM